MRTLDFSTIIQQAWSEYDPTKKIRSIIDVSVRVSTNHVFKIDFFERHPIFAKISYYGKFNFFKEDHIIINNLANNLESPYENFLARSLVKANEVYIFRYKEGYLDAWVIFYNPIKIRQKLPKRLDNKHIVKLAHEVAHFHKACENVLVTLPKSSKTPASDIYYLQKLTNTKSPCEFQEHQDLINEHCEKFFKASDLLGYDNLVNIPVFVDWNIGNFSVSTEGEFFSRWDYDWFRVACRVFDFYFVSRVVSDIGDQTAFSYSFSQLMEDRFLLFLVEYHKIFPLLRNEVLFIKEAYRFFLLNYVIKDGRYFFQEFYASKLQKEAYDLYLPALDREFDSEKLLDALKL